MRILLLALLLQGTWYQSNVARNLSDFEQVVYKKVDTTELKLFIQYPENRIQGELHPAIIFFYGGGWNRRNITHFVPQSNHFAKRGIVAIVADYRVRDIHGTTPFDAVADAKSAIRFIRKHFRDFSIDTSQIVASGGSAGGHIAAAASMVPGLNDPDDDLSISSKACALVLFNPVFDNGPNGFAYKRFGSRYREISPMHNIRPGIPPTIVFLGTEDHGIPVETAKRYKQKMEENGNRCDLMLYEGQKHGFFRFREESQNNNKFFWKTLMDADDFLVSLGIITN